MKPLAVVGPAERMTIDYLTPLLAARGKDVTVGVSIPATWTTGTKSHVQVALDGTPTVRYPIFAEASIRVTVWDTSTTVAQALAALCEGLLLSHPGDDDGISRIGEGTGILPTRDTDTGAQLASISVAVRIRYTVLV